MNQVVSIHEQTMMHISTTVDLSKLSAEQTCNLYAYVADFRTSSRRIEEEFLLLISKLKQIQDLLGDDIYKFAEEVFGLKEWTVKRYLRINAALKTHITTEKGLIDVAEAKHYTKGALSLLNPITDDDVITEIRQLAQNGIQVNEKTVKDIIASRNVDYETRLAEATAEADQANNALKQAQIQRDLEIARSRQHQENSAELLRRANAEKEALQLELDELQKQATVVGVSETVVKEQVVPPAYASIEEAIADAKSKLKAVEAKRDALQQETDALTQKQQAMSQLEMSASEFNDIQQAANELLNRYPAARIAAISSSDPKVKVALSKMGEVFVSFGKHLTSAAAAA